MLNNPRFHKKHNVRRAMQCNPGASNESTPSTVNALNSGSKTTVHHMQDRLQKGIKQDKFIYNSNSKARSINFIKNINKKRGIS